MDQLLLIALGTLASEDLACIAAGVLVAQGRADFVSATLACFAGIFVGDMALYFAGRFGWRLGGRAVAPHRVEAASRWLAERGLPAIVLSRFTPGLRLPTYLAAGFLRLPLGPFAANLALAAAIWTPAVVGLAAYFGENVRQAMSLPAAVAIGFAVWKLAMTLACFEERRRLVGFLRRKLRWEFWPTWAIYAPLLPYFVFLAVRHRSLTAFASANPGIPGGGVRGESKAAILSQLSAHSDRALRFESFEGALPRGWTFPFVLKPDEGERGIGVAVIRSEEDLREYLNRHPGRTLVQEYAAGREFGISYIRYPGEKRGRISSIVEKTFPELRGDGRSTLAELILNDRRAVCLARRYLSINAKRALWIPAVGEAVRLTEIGSHSGGSIFLDARSVWSEALESAVDAAAKTHPGFYLGRFDVRALSIDELREGRFRILELNGVTAEPAHIYDPAVSLWEAYRALAGQWRAAWEIGIANRERGAKPVPVRELLRRALAKSVAQDRNLVPMQEEYGG